MIQRATKPSKTLDKLKSSADWRTDPVALGRIGLVAFRAAVSDAVKRHHAAGRAVPIQKDGKLVWLQPDGSITKSRTVRKPRARKSKAAPSR
jgi:hypothetical protein